MNQPSTIPAAHPPAIRASIEHLAFVQERLSVSLGILCLLALALRFYVKISILRSVRLDDVVMSIAVLLFMTVAVLNMIICHFGRKVDNGDPSAAEILSKTAGALNVIYAACSVACKTSIAIFLARIFEPQSQIQRILIYLLLIISSILATIFSAFSLTCGIQYIQTLPDADNCRLITTANIVSLTWSCSNMLVDLGYAALSAQLIWHTSMPIRTKLLSSTLLSFGSVGLFASILRVTVCAGYGFTVLDQQRVLIANYSALEAGICISAACLATLRPLLRRCMGKVQDEPTLEEMVGFKITNNSDHVEDAKSRL